MYLVDTNVISEARKRERANPGVRAFFRQTVKESADLYLSAVTVGELRRGVELVRRRGDAKQTALLEKWLDALVRDFSQHILPIDADIGQVWGALRAPHAEHAIDKLIAATALMHDLTVVTRNVDDFVGTGVALLNPFK